MDERVSKDERYRELAALADVLLADQRDLVANAANLAALVYHGLPDLNWAGFYFRKGPNEDALVLGPFQGKPACTRIAWGKGVCGTAAARGETVVVADVHQFPGHIACDGASRSEIVVPLAVGGRVAGVLDLDSPRLGRFDAEDQAGLELLVRLFLGRTDIAGR